MFGSDLWTPAQINTSLWLDASDTATITQSSGLVSQWNDKSGKTKHATASGTARPTTGTRTINGKNTLDFATSTNQMVLPTGGSAPLAGATSSMAVFVFQLDADPPVGTATGPILGAWGGVSAGQEHMPYLDGTIYIGFTSTVRKTAGNPSPSMATTACIASFVSAANLFQVYINGSLLLSTTTSTHSVGSNPVIGGVSSNWLDGRVAEIVAIANNTLTDTRLRLEGYMADTSRWGLQAVLPAGHPYKSAPPYV